MSCPTICHPIFSKRLTYSCIISYIFCFYDPIWYILQKSHPGAAFFSNIFITFKILFNIVQGQLHFVYFFLDSFFSILLESHSFCNTVLRKSLEIQLKNNVGGILKLYCFKVKTQLINRFFPKHLHLRQ